MSDPTQAPRHLDMRWRFLPLSQHLVPPKGCTLRENPSYWEGHEGDWAGFQARVAGGEGIGLLPHKSGLVILDCDVKTGFEVVDGVGQMVTHRGIDDLVRVAAGLGETVEPTLCVRTKSGGLHLYYRQNPHCPVMSKAQRVDWLIDVKASPNTYVRVPPTLGYEVVRDLPVAWLPYWLARHIVGLHKRHRSLVSGGSGLGVGGVVPLGELCENDSLIGAWMEAQLRRVGEANQVGSWNNTIYQVARSFFDVGFTAEDVVERIVEAASPWSDFEARNARMTVESAWRNHQGDQGANVRGGRD